jgi:hypothetical protein
MKGNGWSQVVIPKFSVQFKDKQQEQCLPTENQADIYRLSNRFVNNWRMDFQNEISYVSFTHILLLAHSFSISTIIRSV